MGAHAPMGPIKRPPAHNFESKLCLQQGLQRPQGKDGPCSGKTLTTDTQAVLERAAPPLPTQTTDLFVHLVCSGLRKLPNFLGAMTSDYPAVGGGDQGQSSPVSQHLSEGNHSLTPIRLGARLSREPAPLFYILGHKATPVPHCAQLPLL